MQTNTLTLERWSRALGRLHVHIEKLEETLKNIVIPYQISLDTLSIKMPLVQAAREEVYSVFDELDRTILIAAQIELTLNDAYHQSGIQSLQIQLKKLMDFKEVLAPLVERPRERAPVEIEISHAQEQLERLKSSGEGESIRQDRSRLRELTFSLPVIGVEDIAGLKNSYDAINRRIDELECQLQELRSTVTFATMVNDPSHIPLYALAGVSIIPSSEPAPEPVAEQPAAPQRNATSAGTSSSDSAKAVPDTAVMAATHGGLDRESSSAKSSSAASQSDSTSDSTSSYSDSSPSSSSDGVGGI